MKIVILGTGSFALSIAYLLEKNNYHFTFVGRDINQLKQLQEDRRNSKYSNYQFKNSIKVRELEMTATYSDFDILFYCLPSAFLSTVENCSIPIVFTNKGFSKYFLFEKFSNYCILSGGSYAVEILNDIPCYVSLACSNCELRTSVFNMLHSDHCIISLSEFPKDVEIFGIYKNIIAVFCGVIEELHLGKNITSAFLTRCLEYIIHFYHLKNRIAVQPAGIGDLFLSCSSKKSRNFSYGCCLVQNNKYSSEKLVEGVNSLRNLKCQKPNAIVYELHDILQLLYHNNHKDVKNIIMSIITDGVFF